MCRIYVRIPSDLVSSFSMFDVSEWRVADFFFSVRKLMFVTFSHQGELVHRKLMGKTERTLIHWIPLGTMLKILLVVTELFNMTVNYFSGSNLFVILGCSLWPNSLKAESSVVSTKTQKSSNHTKTFFICQPLRQTDRQSVKIFHKSLFVTPPCHICLVWSRAKVPCSELLRSRLGPGWNSVCLLCLWFQYLNVHFRFWAPCRWFDWFHDCPVQPFCTLQCARTT